MSKLNNLTSKFLKFVKNTKSSNGRTYYTYTHEPAQFLSKEPKWTTAEDALSILKSGKINIFMILIQKFCIQ